MKNRRTIAVVIVLVLACVAVAFWQGYGKGKRSQPSLNRTSTTVEKKVDSTERSERAEIPVYSASESWDHIGEYATVEFYVQRTYRSNKNNVFLDEKEDYKNGFVVVIFSNYLGDFPVAPEQYYRHKTIRATGTIEMYKGQPEIKATSEEQIENMD